MRAPAWRMAIGAGVLLAVGAVACAPVEASPAKIRLSIRVVAGDGTVRVWKLNCNPSARSTHPNAKTACALLNRSGPKLLAPVPRGLACSMIYGGSQRATVTGTWGTRRIKASFNRVDGCEAARWQRLIAVFRLPRPGPAPWPGAHTVVTGRVSLGPTCPVQQVGQVCEQTSVNATVSFSSGSETITAQATIAGGFRVALHAGEWSATANVGLHCPTVAIQVPTSAPVVIACDTGIR